MPIIGATNNVITPQTTSTTGTTATTNVTAPAGNTAPVQIVGNPNASGASQNPVRQVSGMPAGFDAAVLTARNGGANGAKEGFTGGYVARPSAGYFVGYGDITRLEPTVDGFELDVQIFTQKQTDEVALFLQLPLLNKKTGEMTFVTLDLLTSDAAKGTNVENIPNTKGKDPISGKDCFTGRRTFRFSLPQINDFIKKSGLTGVEVKPEDRLTISGLVAGDGHRVMNGVSNAFVVPRPIATQAPLSPIDIQTGKAQTLKAQDLPLDISIKLAKGVMDTQLYIDNKYVKVGDIIEGEVTTRLESEYKGSVDKAQMESMIDNAYELADLSEKALAGDAAARKELDKKLGKDLVITAVKRHWMCTDGKPLGERDPATVTIQRDAKGRPQLDPMKDGYSDDKALTFSNNSGAARIRGNAQKAGHAEFKLNGGVLDPKTGIRQRVEVGVSLKAGVTENQFKALLKYMRDNPTAEVSKSPLGHVTRDAVKAGVADALTGDRSPWADVTQIRHKFEIKNTKTGTAGEISLDQVNARTLRKEHEINGQPQEREYFVIETELDHLQINSANTTEQKEAKTKSALTSATLQEQFLAKAKADLAAGAVQFEIMNEPQLHGVEHVKEGSFRQTASYKDFETMNEKALKALCGSQLPGPARQKASHFAELLGLVKPEQTTTV